jgi:hypothetical protein
MEKYPHVCLADGLTLGGMGAGFAGSMLSKALFGSSGIGTRCGGWSRGRAGRSLRRVGPGGIVREQEAER